MNIQSKKNPNLGELYKSFILACVWSAKKYFKTHHGQIRWSPETPLLSNTPLKSNH